VALAAPFAVTAEGSACDATRAVWHDRAAVRRHVGGLIANPQPAAATRPRAKAALSTELTELVESIEPVGDEIVCAEIGIGHVQVGGHPHERSHAAALRRALRRGHADWLADAAFGGTIAMAMAIVGFVVTAYAMHDAVKTGDATVAQSINILDHANFVPAMLGLCCTFLATGLSSLRTGALPRWICLVSVILGVASPLGPAAFAPFALFPVWVIVVAAILARRMRAINSQNPANN
jgi:hypothetical protein